MQETKQQYRYIYAAKYLAISMALILGAGCASLYDNPDENESDIPWNTPQSWEGSPALPGIDKQGM